MHKVADNSNIWFIVFPFGIDHISLFLCKPSNFRSWIFFKYHLRVRSCYHPPEKFLFLKRAASWVYPGREAPSWVVVCCTGSVSGTWGVRAWACFRAGFSRVSLSSFWVARGFPFYSLVYFPQTTCCCLFSAFYTFY